MSLDKPTLADFEKGTRADLKRLTRTSNGQGQFQRKGAKSEVLTLISRCAAEIPLEKIEWLWPKRIARGKHTCIAGEPGTGKSQLTIAIIAAVTTSGEWLCGEGRTPLGNIIILCAEDGAADTIVPRLRAAGADLSRVRVVSAVRNGNDSRRSFNLQLDLELLEKEIERVGNVVLVVIDPISSYLGKADSHKNSEVRGVLAPLSEMADRTRVAILSRNAFLEDRSQQHDESTTSIYRQHRVHRCTARRFRSDPGRRTRKSSPLLIRKK